MTNNTLPNQQQTPASLPDVEMDKVFEPYKKSKFKITAQYNDTGTLLKFYGESPGRKTPWDWFQLLIIPVLVVLISASFGILQVFLSNNLAKQQHDSDQRLAQLQHDLDQNIAHDVQQQVILKTYLDDMSNLLLSTSITTPQLLQANTNDEITKVAQAKTEIALKSLDPKYKADVMTFLYRANLIGWHDFGLTQKTSAFPLVMLDYDDLNGIDLRGVFMDNADLHDTFMDNAMMNNSVLVYDNLSISFMLKADLSGTSLHGSDLNGTDLSGANLNGTLLNCNPVTVNPLVFDYKTLQVCPTLQHVKFTNATMIHVHLQGTDLRSAILTHANLSDALLNCVTVPEKGETPYCVDLRGVDLSTTTLNGADLSGANLLGAKVDVALLEKVAKSLHGTIMPSGTVHA